MNHSDSEKPWTATLAAIEARVEKMAIQLEKTEIADYVELMNRPGRLLFRNLLAGIARGVGVAIGFTVFMISLLYFLRALGALNIPIVGDYIADIIEIVQHQLEGRRGYY
ncbi:hypothetical protein DUZ99_05025 [Xylanibacillus composti]|uniref:Uncharacterized protein n=1 Tax=Xylanibacillus composti TaxID=1572762 RepID=A0A8J4M1C8_9BACL|nr:DUF5665 domain-containing protein [Xylanibacillus composti]MDT9724349.1 hypothetical protein [Xylanibacillus composti]GIQ67940.1 hypothetical protein XYCOK13_07640 [Xylanibacillus composti]